MAYSGLTFISIWGIKDLLCTMGNHLQTTILESIFGNSSKHRRVANSKNGGPVNDQLCIAGVKAGCVPSSTYVLRNFRWVRNVLAELQRAHRRLVPPNGGMPLQNTLYSGLGNILTCPECPTANTI